MPRERRKPCRSLLPDILSNLPDNVIDVILMCLPCKDAVRTSILAKKWRYNWCRRTELALDDSHWRTKIDLLDPTAKFNKIIYQFLTLHEGPITNFTLNISRLRQCPKIDNFIYFLSRNDIQHLLLHFPRNDIYHLPLPSSLFTCSHLRHLTLHNCSIHPPSTFKGFKSLISLKLCKVTISPKLLGRLISRCPLLEQLVLEISKVRNIIEINAPMLRSFEFTGSISFICLKNVPRLVTVSLIGDGSSTKAENSGFAKFFEPCYALEHLYFNYCYNEPALIDEPDEVATRLPFDINCVKRMYMPNFLLEDTSKLARALCLIRSFPHLEYLEIEITNEDELCDQECLKMERLSDVTLNYLREVKLKRFAGTMPEMQLIKLLLAKSPVLLTMLLDRWILDHDFRLNKRLEIFAEISKFSRASAKAEIIYKNLFGSWSKP